MPTQHYAKKCVKPFDQQIDVIAHFYAHNIHPERIAYRTGINIELVNQLISGQTHASVFNTLLAKHRKNRRDQRLKQSLQIKGIAQAALQSQINQEYMQSLNK